MSKSIEMEPLLLMSLLLLGMTSTFNALEDEVSVRLKQGMVSCNDREILGKDPATKSDEFLKKLGQSRPTAGKA